MRIETYNQVASLYKTNKATKTYETEKTSFGRDEVQISQAGRDFQVAKNAVAQAPDVREEKVASLKSSIADGTYSVDTDDFASKLLEKYNAMYQ